MGLLSTHIFKKFCVFSISRFYSRSFVEILHFPSFLQGFCGKKRTLSVIAARCQALRFSLKLCRHDEEGKPASHAKKHRFPHGKRCFFQPFFCPDVENPVQFQFFLWVGTMTFRPPIYGCSTSGMVTVPSACRWFSRKAISIRGGATQVLFRVWAR